MDLTEAEYFKKRWQEYTEKLYKKALHDSNNHSGVITHLEPDILKWEVKEALGSITTNKASGGDGIPRWAISNPKRWCCESTALNMPANSENSAVATGLEKVSFHFNPKERQCWRMFRLLYKIALISHASKEVLKILQARLQQYVNRELPDVQAGFRKGRRTRDQIADISLLDLRKSKRVPEKHLLLLYWLCQSLWLYGWQQTMENSSGDENTIRLYLPPEKSVCRSIRNSFNQIQNNGHIPNW